MWKSLGPRYICMVVGSAPEGSKAVCIEARYSLRYPLPLGSGLLVRVACVRSWWAMSIALKNWFLQATQSRASSGVFSASFVSLSFLVLPSAVW